MSNESPGYQATHFAITKTSTTDWVEVPFGFLVNNIYFENTGAQSVEITFGNPPGQVAQKVLATTELFLYNRKRATSVYLRHTGTATTLLIEAW